MTDVRFPMSDGPTPTRSEVTLTKAPEQPGKRPHQDRLQYALSEVAQKERRALLGVSAAAIAVVYVGLVPTRISALGIDFSPADQRGLLFVAGAILLYFVFTFAVYAWNDYLAWHYSLGGTLAQWERYMSELDSPERMTIERFTKMQYEAIPRIARFQTPIVSTTRNFVEIGFPILFGIIATIYTLSAAFHQPQIGAEKEPAQVATPAPEPLSVTPAPKTIPAQSK